MAQLWLTLVSFQAITMFTILVTKAGGSGSGGAEDVEATVRSLLGVMTTAEKARQLVIEDGFGCCVTNGDFDPKLTADYLQGLGAGILDSMGR